MTFFCRNNQVKSTEFDNYFAFVDGYPCKRLYNVDGFHIISPQGQVQLDDAFIDHNRYCFAVNLNETTEDIDLQLLVCNDQNIRYAFLPICMLLSVLFIIVTLIIFGCIPKLHNLNGKCLICYLATLALGYTLLSGVQLNSTNYVQPLLCDSAGYLIYFTLLSAFLWLSAINFDLWLSFQSMGIIKRMSEKKQFLCYGVYSYGFPCLLTLLIAILDVVESVPEKLRPGVGTKNCFLLQAFLPQFLFFYLPITIVIVLNTVLFISLVIHLFRAQKQTAEVRQSQEDISHYKIASNIEKIDDVRLYLLLFMVAGIAWILEIILFLTPPDAIIFLIIDVWYCLQGILIFILLVLRRPILLLIKERWDNLPTRNNSFENMMTVGNPSASYLRMSSITDDAFME